MIFKINYLLIYTIFNINLIKFLLKYMIFKLLMIYLTYYKKKHQR